MAAQGDTPLRLDGAYTVLTPEYVEFNFVLAGLMSRFLALLIDTALSVAITAALFIALALAQVGVAAATGSLGVQLASFGAAAQFVTWFLVDWGYMVLLETAWNGQTVGKRILGLRVIQDTGVRVGAYPALLRNLVRPLDKLPLLYAVGGLTALFSASQQRLGDLLAGTIVVRDRRLRIPSQLERPGGDTSLLADADFRDRVARLSAEEEALLLSASLRREELGMEARLTLFSALARHLEEALGLGKPAHLSDEKFVLVTTAALAARSAQRRRPAPAPRRLLGRAG